MTQDDWISLREASKLLGEHPDTIERHAEKRSHGLHNGLRRVGGRKVKQVNREDVEREVEYRAARDARGPGRPLLAERPKDRLRLSLHAEDRSIHQACSEVRNALDDALYAVEKLDGVDDLRERIRAAKAAAASLPWPGEVIARMEAPA